MSTLFSDHRSWTTPGAQDAAQKTFASVQAAIKASEQLSALNLDVFLQGSYPNGTNTRGDSDVDVVVMMRRTYMPNTTLLSAEEKQVHEQMRVPGTTTAAQLRAGVHSALNGYYGASEVESRNKCLRVARREGYVDADVVPALQEKRFTSYPRFGSPKFIEGISISPLEGPRIVNYPKEHLKNGNAKNARAGEYKTTVRQVKRLRRAAVDAGVLERGVAPGYLLECMVYNAPDHLFVGDDSRRLVNVVTWMHEQSAEQMASAFWAVDRINHLFVEDPGAHNQYTAKRIADTLWDFL
ncbi:hypothetical protein HDC94_000927 [Leifsonia sp. AK011]|uniref:nucleotidyltransferase domain-containing protein n=1 Tax=Leifsonia sp. AK011 TaxID=2723075 RepID=UPI0015CBAE5A|nr:nucleotidyltransferase [Leifsonia sp. AK011]NYF09771.1 hypothetical protein [Leifsonia sp. AK011]